MGSFRVSLGIFAKMTEKNTKTALSLLSALFDILWRNVFECLYFYQASSWVLWRAEVSRYSFLPCAPGKFFPGFFEHRQAILNPERSFCSGVLPYLFDYLWLRILSFDVFIICAIKYKWGEISLSYTADYTALKLFNVSCHDRDSFERLR